MGSILINIPDFSDTDWWKHARQKDLENQKIHESIRREISRQLRSRIEEISNGIAIRRKPGPFFAAGARLYVIWV